jgi:tetratricopeptide (TPR) repeat protein
MLTEGRALRARGQALIERGRLREAENALREAREMLPSDPFVLGGLVICCVLRGDAAACRDLGQQLATLMPHLPWGHVAIAASFALEGNAASAWMHMARAEERGTNAEVLIRLGGVALLLKEDISAARYFLRALELEPDLEGAQRGLDMARELSRDYESRGSRP